jgi:hypothetical protein
MIRRDSCHAKSVAWMIVPFSPGIYNVSNGLMVIWNATRYALHYNYTQASTVKVGSGCYGAQPP